MAACSVPGDNEPDLSHLSCDELRARWQQLMDGVGTPCERDSDCYAVGAVDSCDCATTLADSCYGVGVSRRVDTTAGDERRRVEAEFRTRCDALAWCDCGPAAASCVAGRCVTGPALDCLGEPWPEDGGLGGAPDANIDEDIDAGTGADATGAP